MKETGMFSMQPESQSFYTFPLSLWKRQLSTLALGKPDPKSDRDSADLKNPAPVLTKRFRTFGEIVKQDMTGLMAHRHSLAT